MAFSQRSWFMRIRFESEPSKKHGVPGLRRALDYRNILRCNGAHHILRDRPTRGRHHLLRGRERKLAPRVSNARRCEHVEIDLYVRRTVLAAVSAVTACLRVDSPARQGGHD
jgi:hypothetical protein